MNDELRSIPLFADLSDQQLQWVREHSEEQQVTTGEIVFREGAEAAAFYVLLDGALQITTAMNGGETTLATHRAGAFTGEMPLLTDTPYIATATATQPSHLLRIAAPDFHAMLSACPPVAGVLLPILAQRIKATQEIMQQRERLAALGQLSAGLAHEMNNPAAAAHRAAAQLRQSLDTLQSRTFNICAMQLSSQQLQALTDLRHATNIAARLDLDPITKSDREDALITWLDAHAVADACNLAPSLVVVGVGKERLDELAAQLPAAALGDALTWLCAALDADTLVGTVETSVGRLADLVQAVKEYSYMDQAPVTDVDIHKGLDNTLTILGFKLKGINVQRDYDLSLPHISARGSELNQVWTNILDNAADALAGKGHITIRTGRENDRLLVEIEDDGPGISAEMQSRIFEPFYTTKEVGQGTGLGLSTAYNIVARHKGELCVESQPGSTLFQVRLPLAEIKD